MGRPKGNPVSMRSKQLSAGDIVDKMIRMFARKRNLSATLIQNCRDIGELVEKKVDDNELAFLEEKIKKIKQEIEKDDRNNAVIETLIADLEDKISKRHQG